MKERIILVVSYDLTIHLWTRELTDEEKNLLKVNEGSGWMLQRNSKPEHFTADIMVESPRPLDHMIEAELERLCQPMWINVMSRNSGYGYSIQITSIEEQQNLYQLTSQYRSPISDILPNGRILKDEELD